MPTIPRKMWRGFAQASAIIVLTVLGAWLLLHITARPDKPVWVTKSFAVTTQTIKVGGDLQYVATLDALESCPARVLHTWVSTDDGTGGATITLARPLVRPGLDVTDRTFTLALPMSIYPGRWHVVMSIESRCPTRVRLDEMARFDVEVTP